MVALTQQNLDILEQTFWAVSDPRSPFYQHFMTQEEILAIVAPPKADHDIVALWLKRSGVKNLKSYGDAIEGTASVVAVEKMFATKMFHFVHEDGRRIVRQWGNLSLPDELAPFVHMVSGLTEFPVPHLQLHPNAGQLGISPQSVQSFYGTPSSYTAKNSSQCVIEFEDQYMSATDLSTFATQFGVKIAAVTPDHIVGSNDPNNPGIEAELDIQYVAGVGLGVTNWFWIEADPNWLYGFVVHFFGTADVPNVISLSYGWSEVHSLDCSCDAVVICLFLSLFFFVSFLP